ncbi:sulfotransferase [Streptomyces calidiresistens]|uniref:Sulfotransferase n=1 Tax=Streptomyces calidiresistens TaxID=1485586 RepID=A0A7W3SZN2_9ACTN|nr:sulfotransferase [Streptomyces calidiresistens]
MDPASLHAEASAATGLHDFGEPTHHEALERLVEALNTEARLNARGVAEVRGTLRAALINRLLLHRSPAPPPIGAGTGPVVITGPPRSGSTFLHTLLACHGGLRAPRLWELMHPVSPPGVPDSVLIEATRRHVAAYYAAAPAMRDIHPMRAEGPEECEYLMTTDFRNTVLGLIGYRVPGYAAWLLDQDLTDAYRLHRLQLRAILARRPMPPGGRLLLKCPSHIWHLPSLVAVHPGTTLVELRRDRRQATASACSLALHARRKRSDEVDPLEIGEQLDRALRLGTSRLNSFTAAPPAGVTHVPVDYEDLVRDPVSTARRLFGLLGLPDVPPALLDRHIERCARRGRHVYSGRDFGLAPDASAHRPAADR